VLPLASSQAARRPYAGVALVLLAMAAASATFGIALHATWERSQDDQAALRVGTDLALALSSPATDREAAAIATATGGSAASAVTDRPLALGRYVGDTGSPPRLVAVDSRRAGQLLRGRLDGRRTWGDVGDQLAPGRSVAGVRLSSGGVSVEGAAPHGVAVTVTPTLVVQDASGFRRTASADAVRLDGRSHQLRGLGDVEGTRLVAARLTLSSPGSRAVGAGKVSVALSVTGSGARLTPSWHVRALGGRDSPVQGSAVRAARSADGMTIRTTAQVDLQFLSFSDANLLATAFATPAVLPVAVSQLLADQVGVKVGGRFSATVGDTEVPLRVATVVPTVPSQPGNPAVLADADTLSRMLIGAGSLEPAVDAWWVADPAPGAARALTRLDLGEVTSRSDVAAQLGQGPLRASIPAALTLLVVAAALLLLAGAALVIGADRPARSAEVARLRALGLGRGGATRLVLTEHGILLGVLVMTGSVVGAVSSLALGPSLIRSDVGIAPVPSAVLEWPWVRVIGVVAGVLVGCLVIAAIVTVFVVRRSGAAQLREVD
jgi:predicted lysophospholipase L1 biosynthesis ABC-type transport system permease subunit